MGATSIVSVASSLIENPPSHPSSPQISFVSDIFAPFSTCKPENATPVYCDLVTCAPGTVPVYYSCYRPYLILKVSWFTMHDNTYFYVFCIYILVSFLLIQKRNVKHVTLFCLNVCY
jgi:hypothetical protein